jgi:hypothetical protein
MNNEDIVLTPTPPPHETPSEWADMVARTFAQRWAPPKKDSKRWEQLELFR